LFLKNNFVNCPKSALSPCGRGPARNEIIRPATKYRNFFINKATIGDALRGIAVNVNNCRVNNKNKDGHKMTLNTKSLKHSKTPAKIGRKLKPKNEN
jgi:hypothetical protein